MRIAFYSQIFLKGNKSGIAWCADNLIRTLETCYEEEYYLQYFSKGYSQKSLEQMNPYVTKNVQVRECVNFKDTWFKLLWLLCSFPYSYFFGKEAEITQFFNFVVPPGVFGKTVTIMHDAVNFVYPQTVSNKTKLWLRMTLKASCRRADRILTVSQFSKMELQKYLQIPSDKIQVMYPGVNFEIYHNNYSQVEIQKVKARYNTGQEYFLYLGTIEPRKNLKRLIQAYSLLKHDFTNAPKLVLAGGKGWLCKEIYDSAKKYHVEEDVVFTGYIPEKDAPALMVGAMAFCFPSIYEGFGSPPVEAMACGTPVLSSNVASMPEVLGDAALLVNPLSVEDIKKGLQRLVQDENFRIILSQKGLKHARKYSWKNAAKVLMDVYKELDKEE